MESKIITEKSEENNNEVFSVYYNSINPVFGFVSTSHIGTYTSEVFAIEGTKKWFKEVLSSNFKTDDMTPKHIVDLHKSIENSLSIQEINSAFSEWVSFVDKKSTLFETALCEIVIKEFDEFVVCVKHKLNEPLNFIKKENDGLEEIE